METELKGFIDIHCHIIPHVDDGAQDSLMTLDMIKIAYECGFRGMIATPHYEVGKYDENQQEILDNYEKIKKMTEEKFPDFKLYLGHEVFYSYGVVEALEEKKINTLADSRYVLIEFSPNDTYKHIKRSLYEVINNGYIPVLAHTERYEEVMADLDNVETLVDAGVYIQINSRTIAGDYGRGIRRKVLKLIKNGLIHFVATDTHSNGRRSPDIRECMKYLLKKTDEETVKRLLITNPQKLIANEYI